MRINWKSLAGPFVSVIGFLASPEFTGQLPDKWAHILIGLGAVVAVVQRPIVQKHDAP